MNLESENEGNVGGVKDVYLYYYCTSCPIVPAVLVPNPLTYILVLICGVFL